MKKHLLILAGILLAINLIAQDTITGWTFPANSGTDSLNANLGLAGNLGYDIRFEGDDTTYNTIYFIDGVEDFAAAATGWDNGANTKFWSVKFKAENFTDIKVSSVQYSDPANPGPAQFKLQWRLSGGDFADIPNGTISLGEDWTTGVVENLPTGITGQGSSSCYIRWIMTSDVNPAGNPVEATGVSAIDNILITGVNNTGINEVIYTNQITLFPNPASDVVTISSKVPVSNLRIYAITGSLVYQNEKPAMEQKVSLDFAPGVYVVVANIDGSDAVWSTRLIIR